MTLVVSLRVPDGVVLAADSLQTTQGTLIPGLKDLTFIAPKSGEVVKIDDLKLPPIVIPTSTSSYAQKLFPFKEKFGVATFGNGIVNQRTMYNHFKNLENQVKTNVDSISSAATIIKNYFANEVKQELDANPNKDLPKDAYLFGFQLVGYESPEEKLGKAIELLFGKETRLNNIDGIGCSVSGDMVLVNKLWELQKAEHMQINFGTFSLQDAIDYAEFLINTTASFQRFVNMIPTVGGAVDIALITNYSKFKWIKYKELTKILEEPYVR
jgi:hypothetical protein